MGVGLPDNFVQVFESRGNLTGHIRPLRCGVRQRIQVGTEGLADLLDLGLGTISLEEDNKYILLNIFTL